MAQQTPIGLNNDKEFRKQYPDFYATMENIRNNGHFSKGEQYNIKMLAIGMDLNTDFTANEIAKIFYEGSNNNQNYSEILSQLPSSLNLGNPDIKMELTDAWRSKTQMFSDTVTRRPNPEKGASALSALVDGALAFAGINEYVGTVMTAADIVSAISDLGTSIFGSKYPLSDASGILGPNLDAAVNHLAELAHKSFEEQYENISDKSAEHYIDWAGNLYGYALEGFVWNSFDKDDLSNIAYLMKTSAQDMIFARQREIKESIYGLWGDSIEATTLSSIYESIFEEQYIKAQSAGENLDSIISSVLSDGVFTQDDLLAINSAASSLSDIVIESGDESKRVQIVNNIKSSTSLSPENIQDTITDMRFAEWIDMDQLINSATDNVYKEYVGLGIGGQTDKAARDEAGTVTQELYKDILKLYLTNLGAITRFSTLIMSDYYPEIDTYSKSIIAEYYEEKKQLPPGLDKKTIDDHMNSLFHITDDFQVRSYPEEVDDLMPMIITYMQAYPEELLEQTKDYYLQQNMPIPTVVTETEALRDRFRGILTTIGFMEYGDWDAYLDFTEKKDENQRMLDAQYLPSKINSAVSEELGWQAALDNPYKPDDRQTFSRYTFNLPLMEYIYHITQNQPYSIDDLFDRRKEELDPKTKDKYDNNNKYFKKGLPYYAQGGRAIEASIFGEAGPEWAIPEQHDVRTAELLNSAREASGFSWTELIASTGGLNGGGNVISNNITYAPVVHANDASGVEDVLSKDKQMLDNWWKQKQWEIARTQWA